MEKSNDGNERSRKAKPDSPAVKVRKYITRYLTENKMNTDLVQDSPVKWEKYGDFVLFSDKSFKDDIWFHLPKEFWLDICDILRCKRLGVKGHIQSDGFRTPQVKVLLSADPWVECIDNKIIYSWNVLENMFSAGNAPERHRIASLNCSDEVIVDLFAGIGYFTLPFLVHAKARFVHACEWSPSAVIALRKNLKLNSVMDRCKIYEGDNNRLSPVGVADRVNLGLIPTSENSWEVACRALKPTGGVLHVHGNVESKNSQISCSQCLVLLNNTTETSQKLSLRSGVSKLMACAGTVMICNQQSLEWGVHVLHSILAFMESLSDVKTWLCTIDDMIQVKSYAPHVNHMVVDISVKPFTNTNLNVSCMTD